MLVIAALNGARSKDHHPAVPTTPAELATAAVAAVGAGAGALHIHPRHPDGTEQLTDPTVSSCVAAVREAVDHPVGVTTGEWVLPDFDARLAAIAAWSVRPDFASVNFHERGAAAVASALLDRGISVEAGIFTPEAADALAHSGLADHCLRIMIEVIDQDEATARATAEAIDGALAGVAPAVPRLLHGYKACTWAMLRLAAARGYDTRIGLEDTVVLPDGTPAVDNAHLVRAAFSEIAGITG